MRLNLSGLLGNPGSIRTRLTAVMLLMSLLPATTIGLVAYHEMSDAVRAENIRDVGLIADAKYDQLVMALARESAAAGHFLSDLGARCGGSMQNHPCMIGLIDSYLASEGATGATLHDKDGREILAIGVTVPLDEEAGFKAGQLARFSGSGPDRNKSYFISATDKTYGLRLHITYPSSRLDAVFNPPPAALGLSGETFLADGEGYFVTRHRYVSTQGNKLPISARPMQSCLGGQSGKVLDLDYRDVAIIHGFRFVPQLGSACIMAHVDQEEAFAPLKSLQLKIIIAMLLSGAMLVVTVIYLARSIVKPITRLTAATREIAAGNYNARADIPGDDEISELGNSFNLMTRRLQASRLKEAEALNELRVMLDTSGEGFWKVDQYGNIVEVNDAYCHLVGYAKDEIVGAHISRFEAIEQTVEHVEAHIRHIIEHGYDRFETRHRHRDGHQVDIEVSTSFIPEKKFFIAFLHDITERKRAEVELRRNQKLLNEAQRLGRLGSWENDLVTDELRWSEEIYRIFELDPALFSPSYENYLRVVHPEDRRKIHQAYTRSLENRQPYDIEHRLLLKDGRIKWVHEHCSSDFDASGQPLRSMGAVQDITEQHLVSEQLRIAAATFEVQDAILITDNHSTILRVNQAFEELSGYSAEELIGKNPKILQSGRHDKAFFQGMWAELLATGKWSGEIWDRRKNGEVYPKYMTVTAVCNEQHQVTHYVAVSSDISQRKDAEQKIHRLAFYDPLTELPNRRLLLDRLHQAIAVSARTGRHGSLMFMDMDYFKTINDTQGHAAGDMLLIEVARRLQHCVREGDSIARLGGDEFVVVLEELSHSEDVAATQTELVASKIRNTLNQPYILGDHTCHSTPSIGISLFLGHQESMDDLLKHADVAMYHAKSSGRNAIRFFDPQMQMVLDMRAALEADLRQALERQQFSLHYQIQVDYRFQPLGAEVLLRWEHPERGQVFPDQFISLAEDTGLIVPIGIWVMQTACGQLKSWQQDELTRELTLSVNVSARQFRQADFVAKTKQILLESGASPSLLKLELTESTVLENVDTTISKMHELKLIGVSFAMDDFGTGYSSLQYLKRLPLDQIKIDQTFVHDLAVDESDKAIVTTIVAMAHGMNLDVIAEGVETEEQREFLLFAGCCHYQGYLFGKPLPLDQFEELLMSAGSRDKHDIS